MSGDPYGIVLSGDEASIREAYDAWLRQPVDQEMSNGEEPAAGDPQLQTLKSSVSVTGPGTFLRRAQRTLSFGPASTRGWWFDRTDLPQSLPILSTVNNVWTTVRNIVLCSGSPHNYMRMVEHILALKVGLGIDSATIRLDSGDPPLFDRSSRDLYNALASAGAVPLSRPAGYVSVREPVTVGARGGSFLTFLPAEDGRRQLHVDCAVDFKTAIGKQRIRFPVTRKTFCYGSIARTNTTLWMMLYCRTIGLLFADTRSLGYTVHNILVAGPRRYHNEPRLVVNGKSLEAVWHRATLDLLAAVGLINRGRFVGRIISYKSGHALDVEMVRQLYHRDLLVRV